MSDELNQQERPTYAAENAVVDANCIEFQKGLAGAINDTYSYSNNSLFGGIIPAYYKDYYYRYIRVATQWLDGFVWSLHQGSFSGIVSTRLAGRLTSGLTKQIVGEKLVYKVNDRDIVNKHEILHFVSKWAEEVNVKKAVYAGIGYALAIGTSLVKANRTGDGKVWWEAIRLDNCFYRTNFRGDVEEATCLIRNYTDTTDKNSKDQFFLVEKRYWKTWDLPKLEHNKATGEIKVLHRMGDKVPMVVYNVHRVRGTILNNTMPNIEGSSSCNWQELPKPIRNAIKKDYALIRVDEEQELGFADLGVVVLRNGECDLSIPTGNQFGESMLVGIQDDLITYEVASSYLLRDMYLGKGTVYVPKSQALTDFMPNLFGGSNVMNNVGEDKIEVIKGISPENQKILVEQFDIRQDAWQTIKENALKNIAVKIGTSPKILANFLTQGAAMTATQIDSEDDSLIAYLYHERSYFKNSLNKLLKTTLNFYGYEDSITLDFASPSLINKDRLLNRIQSELQAGLTTIEDAIRTLNPDLDEEALQRKIDDAHAQQEQMMMAGVNEMNDDGTFGQDTSDNMLEGSTVPIN